MSPYSLRRCLHSHSVSRQRLIARQRPEAQAGDGGASPPPVPPRKTDQLDYDGPGDPHKIWRLIRSLAGIALLLHLLQMPASAIESLPVDAGLFEADPAKLKLGGPAEGQKDDIETIRRLLRDLFMEQLVRISGYGLSRPEVKAIAVRWPGHCAFTAAQRLSQALQSDNPRACSTPPQEWEPPLIISPNMDPMEVVERSGRDYEPASYVEEAPEDEHDPIMVRLACL